MAWKQEAARCHIPVIHWSRARSELKVLWEFAVPAVLGNCLVNPVNWAGISMLSRRVHGLENVGTLNAANQWFGALLWLPYAMDQTIMPILAERIAMSDKTRSARLLSASIKINLAITLPFLLAGSLLSQHIMGAYGRDFRADWLTLVVSLATTVIVSVQLPVGNLIAACDRMWLGFGMNLVWAITFLISAWLLLSWGALGLVSARLIGYCAQCVWALGYAMWWTTSGQSRFSGYEKRALDRKIENLSDA